MKLFSRAWSVALVWSVVLGSCVAPAVAAGSLSYDDPGMHFKAPDGWQRIDVPSGDSANSQDKPPVAVFAFDPGHSDAQTIIITIRTADSDSLDAFERSHEGDLRQGSDSTNVDKRTHVTLANGMPAYLVQTTSGDGLQSIRRYEYLVYDGARDIDVAFAGHQGEFTEKQALAALSTLYVVAYPGDRT